ncbi:MAG: hypothetical protein WEB87_02415 [Bacteriovoracaceae bacterium]
MRLNIGFIKSEAQFLLKEVDTVALQVESKALDTVEIKDKALNLLFFGGESPPPGLQSALASEEKFYPIVSGDSLGLDLATFESLEASDLTELYAKVNARWILSNNIKTIEQIYSLISYLKDLWKNDRNSFFEELWFVLKTNLASVKLTAIFHDAREENPEKNEKPSLFHSYVTGEKTPQIFDGAEKEDKIMKEYESEFGEYFNITEFDSSQGRMVATVKIGLSPILIMAELNTFNQLQRSVLIAIFSGLQDK